MQHNLFIGRAADAPVLQGSGDKAVGRITLIANEYAGKDEGGAAREKTVALPLTAFGPTAENIVKHVMKGDELKVTFRIENNNYIDKQQNDVYGYNFIIETFDFGQPGAAKREKLEAQNKG